MTPIYMLKIDLAKNQQDFLFFFYKAEKKAKSDGFDLFTKKNQYPKILFCNKIFT